MAEIKKFPDGPHFPESEVDNTGSGPDFPGSSGDRERGKFRPSATPRLTTVAISDDDGQPVNLSTNDILLEILAHQKAILAALALLSQSERFEPLDAFRAG